MSTEGFLTPGTASRSPSAAPPDLLGCFCREQSLASLKPGWEGRGDGGARPEEDAL